MNISIPQSWNELSDSQLAGVALIFHNYRSRRDKLGSFTLARLDDMLYVQLVGQLLKSVSFYKMWIALRRIPPKAWSAHVRFLYHDVDRTHFPKPFRIKGKKFIPPADRLRNVTVAEFSYADALYYNFKTSGKQVYLNALCATLYRPVSDSPSSEDHRILFTKMHAEDMASRIAKLPLKKRLAIALAFEGCRNYKVSLYPNVFPPEKEDPSKKKKPAKYTPFGELISHKIQWDPSKLQAVETMQIDKFLGVYENELRELKKRK